MSFPDLATLRRAFDYPTTLPFQEGESEASYRERCAVWSETLLKDHVQAHEIRTGRGWDQWSDVQKNDLLKRKLVADTMLGWMLRRPDAK